MLPLIFGLVSLLFLVIGWLIWKQERIDLLHDYHRNHVSEEDKKRFCAMCGMGVGVIGIGMLLTAVLFAVCLRGRLPAGDRDADLGDLEIQSIKTNNRAEHSPVFVMRR